MPLALLSVRTSLVGPWSAALREAAEDAGLALDLRTDPDRVDPDEVEHLIFARGGPVADFRGFGRLKLIQTIWAGVENIVGDPTLPEGVPFCRMVEPGMVEGMRDYVCAHVLRYHTGLDRFLRGEEGVWHEGYPPLARSRKVGVLGLGELGGTCARALAALGFDVAGWSRTLKEIEGVACHAGAEGLDAVLARSEILVALLPRTAATENLLDARALARLPAGARIVNAGRGELIDDAALLDAIRRGHVAGATLDVFREEPLPADHPFRDEPAVTVTPHIASATRPETAAPAVVAQILRAERGEPLVGLVDRARGY